MRIGNLSGRLALFTDRGAVDVAEASGGRFGSYTQAITRLMSRSCAMRCGSVRMAKAFPRF